MNTKGILICGHGSRMTEGVEAFNQFAKGFQDQLDGYETEPAFLELSEPDFDTGVKRLVAKGVKEIIALPLFLFTGIHIQKDIPCMLYQVAQKHQVSIKMGRYMGVCDEMVNLSEGLIKEALPSNCIDNPESTALVIAGVGSSKIQANADLSALLRLIQERFRFPFASIGFLSRMTFPPLKETMTNVGLLPYKNIVVLPYFFFPGIYMNRAEKEINKATKSYPQKQFFRTNLLASNQALYDVLHQRLQEVDSGQVDMITALNQEELEHYHEHSHSHGHHHSCNHHHH